jgi:hypothetical protein
MRRAILAALVCGTLSGPPAGAAREAACSDPEHCICADVLVEKAVGIDPGPVVSGLCLLRGGMP